MLRFSLGYHRNEATHLQLTEIRPPGVVHELQPVVFGEVAQVGDEGGDEEDISAESPLLLLKVFHRLCPAHVLGGQPPHLKSNKTKTSLRLAPGGHAYKIKSK